MSGSSRAGIPSSDADARVRRSRSGVPLILGSLGLLLVGGLIGAVVTGGIDLGSSSAPDAATTTPSGSQSASVNSSTTGGVPLPPSGSELATVTTPPPRTVTHVTMEKNAKVTYRVMFMPYGWAPTGLGENRLVIRIQHAERSGEGVDIDLTGMNAVVETEPPDGPAGMTKGGEYEGLIEVRASGNGRGALVLTEVTATQ
ncbi:MAG: hypothetical protein ABFC80_05245 [Coriobacteriales bacterium]